MWQNIDRIIARHLANEATPKEQRLLQAWLAESEQNRTFFAALVSDAKPNTENAWATFERYMRQNAVAATPPSPRTMEWRLAPLLLRYAAAAALLVGVAALAWISFGGNDAAPQILLIAENKGEAREYVLSDSSCVFLSKGSKLSCVGDYSKGKRELLLEGEAFFEVSAESSGQLVVHADQTLIRDVGTTFNVQAYPESGSVTVFVQSGEVHFYTEANSGVTLKAGETGTFDKRSQTFSHSQTDANAIAYMTKTFMFKDKPLNEVIALVNRVYSAHICVSDSATAAQIISVTFDDEGIDEIVEVLSETLHLQSTVSGDTCMLSPQLVNNVKRNAKR
jgi:ferric-dicitrate binding protein FerR (iron transport regulator)